MYPIIRTLFIPFQELIYQNTLTRLLALYNCNPTTIISYSNPSSALCNKPKVFFLIPTRSTYAVVVKDAQQCSLLCPPVFCNRTNTHVINTHTSIHSYGFGICPTLLRFVRLRSLNVTQILLCFTSVI